MKRRKADRAGKDEWRAPPRLPIADERRLSFLCFKRYWPEWRKSKYEKMYALSCLLPKSQPRGPESKGGESPQCQS